MSRQLVTKIARNGVFVGYEIGTPSLSEPPTFSQVGVPASTTLTSFSGQIQSNTTYTNRLFSSSVSTTATNVTFERCKFLGNTSWQGGSYTFEDCDFDGNESTYPSLPIIGVTPVSSQGTSRTFLTMRRCRIWNGSQGIQAGHFTLEDSWIGDLWGRLDAHMECLLLYNYVTVRNCTLLGNFKQPGGATQLTNGGMSASVAAYTHGSFWGNRNGLTLENNLLQSVDAYYTVYWGTPPGQDGGQMTNCVFRNNKFRRRGPGLTSSQSSIDIIQNMRSGFGNDLSNNVYEDTLTPVSIGQG